MFVGQHGSWNRSSRSGYKVIFVPFEDARPQGLPVDVLTGFLNSLTLQLSDTGAHQVRTGLPEIPAACRGIECAAGNIAIQIDNGAA